MSLAATFGLCALLVALTAFMARIAVECDVVDVLALVGISVSLGYLWGIA